MILLVGYGCEGRAIYRVFSSNYPMSFVDPKYTTKTIQDYPDITSVIFCVPFEYRDSVCDTSKLADVLRQLPVTTPVMIRSTISLEAWRRIRQEYPDHQLAYSPSFLRKALPDHDMKNLKEIIISGDQTNYWQGVFASKYTDLKIYTQYSVEEAISIKLFRTAFLATKLSLFNQIYDFCEHSNLSYDAVRQGVTSDDRIGESHSFVDIDFTRFWCNQNLKNEINMLLTASSQVNTQLSIIETARVYNQNQG